jgi:hypothetical protein
MKFVSNKFDEASKVGTTIYSHPAGYRNVFFSKKGFFRDRYYLKFPEIYYCFAYKQSENLNFSLDYLALTFFDSRKHYFVPLPNFYLNSKICLGFDCDPLIMCSKNLDTLCHNVASFFWSSQFDIYEFYGLCRNFCAEKLFPPPTFNGKFDECCDNSLYNDGIAASYSQYLDLWEKGKANIFLYKGFSFDKWMYLVTQDARYWEYNL